MTRATSTDRSQLADRIESGLGEGLDVGTLPRGMFLAPVDWLHVLGALRSNGPSVRVRWEFLPEEPTYGMLRALAGDPIILAASDEEWARLRYFAMLKHCPCPGGPYTIGECNGKNECGCVYGSTATVERA